MSISYFHKYVLRTDTKRLIDSNNVDNSFNIAPPLMFSKIGIINSIGNLAINLSFTLYKYYVFYRHNLDNCALVIIQPEHSVGIEYSRTDMSIRRSGLL